MQEDNFHKTKEEQQEDFKIIASRANADCDCCVGKGYSGFDITTQRYVPCLCVLKNIEKELEELGIEDKGILQQIRQTLGLN